MVVAAKSWVRFTVRKHDRHFRIFDGVMDKRKGKKKQG